MLDIILQLLGQLLTGLIIPGENDGGLDHSAADGVRSAGNSTFQHCGMLHQHAFDLKGSDAVAGSLDDIIGAAHIPEVTVLITPRGIAGCG